MLNCDPSTTYEYVDAADSEPGQPECPNSGAAIKVPGFKRAGPAACPVAASRARVASVHGPDGTPTPASPEGTFNMRACGEHTVTFEILHSTGSDKSHSKKVLVCNPEEELELADPEDAQPTRHCPAPGYRPAQLPQLVGKRCGLVDEGRIIGHDVLHGGQSVKDPADGSHDLSSCGVHTLTLKVQHGRGDRDVEAGTLITCDCASIRQEPAAIPTTNICPNKAYRPDQQPAWIEDADCKAAGKPFNFRRIKAIRADGQEGKEHDFGGCGGHTLAYGLRCYDVEAGQEGSATWLHALTKEQHIRAPDHTACEPTFQLWDAATGGNQCGDGANKARLVRPAPDAALAALAQASDEQTCSAVQHVREMPHCMSGEQASQQMGVSYKLEPVAADVLSE